MIVYGAFGVNVHRNRIGVFLHINDTLFPIYFARLLETR